MGTFRYDPGGVVLMSNFATLLVALLAQRQPIIIFSGYGDIMYSPSLLPPKLRGDVRGHSEDMHTHRTLKTIQ